MTKKYITIKWKIYLLYCVRLSTLSQIKLIKLLLIRLTNKCLIKSEYK